MSRIGKYLETESRLVITGIRDFSPHLLKNGYNSVQMYAVDVQLLYLTIIKVSRTSLPSLKIKIKIILGTMTYKADNCRVLCTKHSPFLHHCSSFLPFLFLFYLLTPDVISFLLKNSSQFLLLWGFFIF